jgi:hypothetical protein
MNMQHDKTNRRKIPQLEKEEIKCNNVLTVEDGSKT